MKVIEVLEKMMKHHTEGGRMIKNFDGKKDYILSEEDMNYLQRLVKYCSIPDAVEQNKRLSDLDCKTVPVKFKVIKFIPKVVID